MGYLQEFQTRFMDEDSAGALQLWEEYCASDHADAVELQEILKAIKASSFPRLFGPYVENALPLWELVEDSEKAYEVIWLIVDLQTTNNPSLAKIIYNLLEARYGGQPYFNEKIRLVGLRSQENFQGAISNYELLSHLDKGKYVYHTAGWGTGEIIDISLTREELALEFELVLGKRDLTFENAFKNLVALGDDHFLARRFGKPDDLEKEARKNPIQVVRMLLKDLGPKTAAEIKEELFELVIPATDWTKWWQSARAKIKKDTMIASPGGIKESFVLLQNEVSHEERFQKILEGKTEVSDSVQAIYQFTRDFPETLKNAEFKDSIREKLIGFLRQDGLSKSQKLQLYVFLDNLFGIKEEDNIPLFSDFIKDLEDVEKTINDVEIIAFKKRALVAIRDIRKDWVEIFLATLFSIQQSVLRDYILRELNCGETQSLLEKRIFHLVESPTLYPEAFVWYFQKVVGGGAAVLPSSDKKGQCRLFESFLILYHYLEQDPQYRDLVKKMYIILSKGRYACVRSILNESSIEYVKEILLLVTKCQTFSNHDIKILHSLAEVVHPSLAKKKALQEEDDQSNVIWTTPEGYSKIKKRIHQIGTVETVENAKEIEAARALGDLRENSEYKFALEKRSRLQAELKLLSDQLNRARILTEDDVQTTEAGIGSVVKMESSKGEIFSYTILGPWEADPEKKVLSFQSKLAQSMAGCKEGGNFSFQGEEYTIREIKSYLV